VTRQVAITCMPAAHAQGCLRKLGGQETFDRHHYIAGDRWKCYTDRELQARGMYQDRFGVWHRSVNPEQGTLSLSVTPVSDEAPSGNGSGPRPLSDPDRNAVGAAHREAGDTERGAAVAIMPRTGTWRRRVLDAIALSEGLTDWEIHNRVGGLLYTVAPRRNELLRDGWIRDSGERRRTNSTNRAIVWVLTDQGRAEWVPAEVTA